MFISTWHLMIRSYVYWRSYHRMLVYYLRFEIVCLTSILHFVFPYLSYCMLGFKLLLRTEAFRNSAKARHSHTAMLKQCKLAFNEQNVILKLAEITWFQIGLFMYHWFAITIKFFLYCLMITLSSCVCS